MVSLSGEHGFIWEINKVEQMNCQAAMLPPCLTNMEKKDMDEKVLNNIFLPRKYVFSKSNV